MCAAIKSSMLDDFLNVSAGSVVHKKSNASSESEKMLLRGNRFEIFQVNGTSPDVFGYKGHASGISGYPSILAEGPVTRSSSLLMHYMEKLSYLYNG